MNWAVSNASRCTLSSMTKRVDTAPSAMATVPITAMLISENQRSRLNDCLREPKRRLPSSTGSDFDCMFMAATSLYVPIGL
ncbi:hypothetical protein D3C78_1611720 [compost metagenome]